MGKNIKIGLSKTGVICYGRTHRDTLGHSTSDDDVEKHIISIVMSPKFSGGSIMVWNFMTAAGVGELFVSADHMNNQSYTQKKY
ncbi:hypothetical protein Trydic_g13191 [Trypoxylus dichotomus]